MSTRTWLPKAHSVRPNNNYVFTGRYLANKIFMLVLNLFIDWWWLHTTPQEEIIRRQITKSCQISHKIIFGNNFFTKQSCYNTIRCETHIFTFFSISHSLKSFIAQAVKCKPTCFRKILHVLSYDRSSCW